MLNIIKQNSVQFDDTNIRPDHYVFVFQKIASADGDVEAEPFRKVFIGGLASVTDESSLRYVLKV